MTNGRIAVSVTNRGTASINGPTLQLTDLYLAADTKYTCREVWTKTENVIENSLNIGTLKACETKVYVLTPQTPTSILCFSDASSKKSSAYYDLSGRRVTKDHKGLTIHNGIKTVK